MVDDVILNRHGSHAFTKLPRPASPHPEAVPPRVNRSICIDEAIRRAHWYRRRRAQPDLAKVPSARGDDGSASRPGAFRTTPALICSPSRRPATLSARLGPPAHSLRETRLHIGPGRCSVRGRAFFQESQRFAHGFAGGLVKPVSTLSLTNRFEFRRE